jgi:hypothetical protein
MKDKELKPLPFEVSQFIDGFIFRNCVPLYDCRFAGDEYRPPYIESEIKIVIHADGKGYVHVLNRDSETVNFDLDSREAMSPRILKISSEAKAIKKIQDIISDLHKRGH